MKIVISKDGTACIYREEDDKLLAYTVITLFHIDIIENSLRINSLCKEFVFVDESIKDYNRNTIIFKTIEYYCNNMYNKFLWRSSDKNPKKLYRPITNVKGVSLKLFPFANIIE